MSINIILNIKSIIQKVFSLVKMIYYRVFSIFLKFKNYNQIELDILTFSCIFSSRKKLLKSSLEYTVKNSLFKV